MVPEHSFSGPGVRSASAFDAFPQFYYRPEYTLLFATLFSLLIPGLKFLIERLRRLAGARSKPAFRVKQLFTVAQKPALVVSATAFFVLEDGEVRLALDHHGFVDEIRLERAAAKEVNGSHATVGGIFVLPWFTGGGAVYRDLIGELIYPPDISGVNTRALFKEMDAVVETGETSELTYNKQRKTLTSFYLDGVLSLRGFYSGRLIRHVQEELLFMSQGPATEVKGFYWQNDKFYEFSSSRDGDVELIVVEMPAGKAIGTLPQKGQILFTLQLPGQQQGAASPTLVVMLQRSGAFETLKQMYSDCLLRDHILGRVTSRDPGPMLESISYQQETVNFY
jgi:hypothetical protein